MYYEKLIPYIAVKTSSNTVSIGSYRSIDEAIKLIQLDQKAELENGEVYYLIEWERQKAFAYVTKDKAKVVYGLKAKKKYCALQPMIREYVTHTLNASGNNKL